MFVCFDPTLGFIYYLCDVQSNEHNIIHHLKHYNYETNN